MDKHNLNMLDFLYTFVVVGLLSGFWLTTSVLKSQGANIPTEINTFAVTDFYTPTGWMLNNVDPFLFNFTDNFTANCTTNTPCIKITWRQPKTNEWIGLYWLHPKADAGQWPAIGQPGCDLTGATQVKVWARGERGGEKLSFMAAFYAGRKVETPSISLNNQWTEYTIDLNGADLTNVVGAFGYTVDGDNSSDITFYLDKIVYEGIDPAQIACLNVATMTSTPTLAAPTLTATGSVSVTTFTPTATSTSVATPSPTPTLGGSGSSVQLYLPAIAQVQFPTPVPTPIATITPLPVWKQIAGNDFEVAKLAIQAETLFASTRGNGGEPNRGLYSGSIAGCHTDITLGRVRAIPESSVLDITFQGQNGVTVSYDNGIYYSADSGGIWTSGVPLIERPRSVAIVTNIFFIGTQDKGIYLSTDGGRSWTQRRNEPKTINVVKLDTKAPELLWIGTEGEGVYSLHTGDTDIFIQNKAGLSGDALHVWDFAFETTQIYLATQGGIFVGDGESAWKPFAATPAGVQFYTLELAGATLYAGAKSNGVWRKSLTSGDWQPVVAAGWKDTYTIRDLLYDASYCNGLLAATEDGVWLYR